ncbi:Origin recognition complex subunit 5, partial [Stegodyphus mimosarum]
MRNMEVVGNITNEPECQRKNAGILYRDDQKEFLINFFGYKNSLPYPSLFIYGHTSTGKTLLVSRLVDDLSLLHAWVNCHELCNPQLIFSSIIQQLSSGNAECKRSYNFCEFINFIKDNLKNENETTYLVFDCAEVLRKLDPFFLSVLIRIQELSEVNISSIFISELPWIKFRNQMFSFNPVSLHFPNYTKDQICDILALDCPSGYSVSFYEGYINVIMKTFFTVTRNLSELRHLAQANFEKYCEPLKEEPEDEISSMRLWKNIEPTLKKAMNSVYLRELSGSKWSKLCTVEQDKGKIQAASGDSFHMTRELPFYTKFLLLASYFASYNSPKTDFKHFVKNQGKQPSRRKCVKAEKNRHLLGPKPFPLDRMLAIFFAIVGEKVLPSAVIYSQVSSLVSMRLLHRISADEQLDCPKYKCLAELDLVEKIGKTVNLDVM